MKRAEFITKTNLTAALIDLNGDDGGALGAVSLDELWSMLSDHQQAILTVKIANK